jgi:hypothetical protein
MKEKFMLAGGSRAGFASNRQSRLQQIPFDYEDFSLTYVMEFSTGKQH